MLYAKEETNRRVVCIDGKMPKVKPKFSKCCFCEDKLTPGLPVKGLIEYDPTKPTALEQWNIYYSHASCLNRFLRRTGWQEVPPIPGMEEYAAKWGQDRWIRFFWLKWAELKGISFEVRAMMLR